MAGPSRILSLTLLIEFQRATAAAHRYSRLKCQPPAALALLGIEPAGIPRQVFAEFYESHGRFDAASNDADRSSAQNAELAMLASKVLIN